MGVFLQQRGGAGGERGGYDPPGHAWPPGAPRRVVPPLVLLRPILCLLVQKNSPKSFAAFGLRLVLIFYEVKNKQTTATGTGHYVNRLVPKNDIKLL